MQETWVWSLGWEDPLRKEVATHSQYSCPENPMDREAWQAAVHGVTESQTQPINQHFYFHTFTNVGPGQIRSKATFEKQDSRVSHLKKQDQKKNK